MTVGDVIAAACYVAGAFFFVAGTVGILRFPDVYTRLHALTKADGLGLGFVVAGLSLQAESVTIALKLWLIWALVLAGSSISCQLVARSARRSGVEPWRST
jgi:multicomponent Na+:H+ antiporter subunit G